ncbi:MAG: hypothetical protein WC697_03070 [Patescibacteria group bacterium]|jgi:hypothetical protein
MRISHFDAQYNLLKRDDAQSNERIRKLLRPLCGKEVLITYPAFINGLAYDTTLQGCFRICTHQNAIHLMWESRLLDKKYSMKIGFYRIKNMAIFKKGKG